MMMTDAMAPQNSAHPATPTKAMAKLPNCLLTLSSQFWFVVMLVGQWFFAYYIFVSYGSHALEGDMAGATEHLITGFVEGDLIGNIGLIVHLALAFVITFCGPLQLIPAIRKHAPKLHRINGRIYIFTAFIISIGAIYMVATRGSVTVWNSIALGIDGVLIIFFAAMTMRYAIARKISIHHRWALRTFIAVSGVWFYRVMFAPAIVSFQGLPPGSTPALDGPFDITLSFACFLIPLAILEVYLRVKANGGAMAKSLMALALTGLTLVMGFGIFSAGMIMWLPRL
jgi:hypothetical protein